MSSSDAATIRIVDEVLASRRYRDMDARLVQRLAAEELPRHGTEAEAVKQVKRRLHQAVGAYRPHARGRAGDHDELDVVRAAWHGDFGDAAFRTACARLLTRHASTRERLPHLDAFYPAIWEAAGGRPASVMDLGCGLAPLALPWMDLPLTTEIIAIDVDTAQLRTVDAFLTLVGQPHAVEATDLAATAPTSRASLALILKLVPLLDRQDPGAARRLLAALDATHAAISFPRHSLGGRGKGMEATYRRRFNTLIDGLGDRVADIREASVPNELVFVLALRTAADG